MEDTLADRQRQGREPVPNLRGEDETEISYLINLIETQAWILIPPKHPTCVIGRYPPPENKATDSDEPKFCASLYSMGMGKGGVKCLDFGPRLGQTRKEALSKLLRLVETRIGEMMMNDRDDAREGRSRSGNGERN